jgi:hypothetical protein
VGGNAAGEWIQAPRGRSFGGGSVPDAVDSYFVVRWETQGPSFLAGGDAWTPQRELARPFPERTVAERTRVRVRGHDVLSQGALRWLRPPILVLGPPPHLLR